jgi:hypothetical protein
MQRKILPLSLLLSAKSRVCDRRHCNLPNAALLAASRLVLQLRFYFFYSLEELS